ncbi:hypothetical protein F2Q70_00011525 [Brassica cretica]|uniref:Uncharacterized protein n=1 Tax=Brassica cretica TaxID=69181 RepID=A0A8S9M8T2_BRACR|nr:hypothetical protein F2Q70_00011525 [Brassica cretica]KAF3547043.1 hypothetical protein DY000_02006858 [Brassica cretica]
MHGFVSYRRSKRARSLRSDRAWPELGRYVATEPCAGRLLRGDLVRIFLRCFVNVFSPQDSS